MGRRGLRSLAAGSASVVAITMVMVIMAIGVAARPLRYRIDGISMAPALRPGDVVVTSWFPRLDGLRGPRRFERWIVAMPDGGCAIKRVAGLPGESVSIRGGDLAVRGRTILASPRLLAERGTAIATSPTVPSASRPRRGIRHHDVESAVVFDDASFAPHERRQLLPVQDVGVAAVIHMPAKLGARHAGRIRARVGHRVITWRISGHGHYGLVAGRLDGHLVGVMWPIPPTAPRSDVVRCCLPSRPPAAWDVAEPWIDAAGGGVGATVDEDAAPELAVDVEPLGLAAADDSDGIGIDTVSTWRDVLLRPAADGVDTWQLGPQAYFLLGDFPSGSRDSRHWGPLGADRFRNRVLVDGR